MRVILALLLVGLAVSLPTNFDARTNWGSCGWFILNQESCGSCWDFCSVESFADRMCITGEAPSGTIISPEPILDCSKQGCDGGYPSTAWDWLINDGDTTCTQQCFSGCQPYDSGKGTSPACHQGTCDSGAKWTTTYYAGSFKGLSGVRNHDLNLYQTELYNNGPLQACFTVYNNFYTYFSLHPKGIYNETGGPVVGGHCVKLIGWGTDGSQDYWLLANSWDTNWADGGYFRMARGNNLAGIEGQVSEGFTKKQTLALGMKLGEIDQSTFLVGGWEKQSDLENELVTEAASAGTRLLKDKLKRDFVLSQIVSAETQVVAGVNFKIVARLGDAQVFFKLYRDTKSEYSLKEYKFL